MKKIFLSMVLVALMAAPAMANNGGGGKKKSKKKAAPGESPARLTPFLFIHNY